MILFRRNNQPSKSHEENHTAWLSSIRDTVWHRVSYENQVVPSDYALKMHWSRTCWVIQMWSQASHNTMSLQPTNRYGWKMSGEELEVVWDSDDNIRKVRQRVALLLEGCKCKTGCRTNRCKCQKKGSLCTPGCSCINCTNLVIQEAALQFERDTHSESDDSDEQEDLDMETIEYDIETDKLMDTVFGDVTELQLF